MIELFTSALDEIALVGAHCDDIAIGMGGTLLTLAARPRLRVRGLVLSGGGTEREAEEIEALGAFCPGADVDVTVLNIPDGRAPAHWDRIKNHLSDFRRSCTPDVVFGPQRADAHQDHRLLAELLPTEFRDHLVLGAGERPVGEVHARSGLDGGQEIGPQAHRLQDWRHDPERALRLRRGVEVGQGALGIRLPDHLDPGHWGPLHDQRGTGRPAGTSLPCGA